MLVLILYSNLKTDMLRLENSSIMKRCGSLKTTLQNILITVPLGEWLLWYMPSGRNNPIRHPLKPLLQPETLETNVLKRRRRRTTDEDTGNQQLLLQTLDITLRLDI